MYRFYPKELLAPALSHEVKDGSLFTTFGQAGVVFVNIRQFSETFFSSKNLNHFNHNNVNYFVQMTSPLRVYSSSKSNNFDPLFRERFSKVGLYFKVTRKQRNN